MDNTYEVYRTTTLGLALQETLDEMIQVCYFLEWKINVELFLFIAKFSSLISLRKTWVFELLENMINRFQKFFRQKLKIEFNLK